MCCWMSRCSKADWPRGAAAWASPIIPPGMRAVFGADDLVLIVTTSEFLLFRPGFGRPASARHRCGRERPDFARAIRHLSARDRGGFGRSFRRWLLADGYWMFGLTDTIRFRYDVRGRTVSPAGYTSDPTQGPRVVSVSRDGSYFTAGWGLFDSTGRLLSQFPNPSGQLNVGSHAIDSASRLIYAQIPQGQPQSAPGAAAPTPASAQPP